MGKPLVQWHTLPEALALGRSADQDYTKFKSESTDPQRARKHLGGREQCLRMAEPWIGRGT